MKSTQTRLEEYKVIAKDLWKKEQERRKDPNEAHDVSIELQMYKELNELGFDFYWHWQLQPTMFSKKDKGIVPIFLKYSSMFESKWFQKQCLHCLGVKGLYDATEALIAEYKKCLSQYDRNIVDIRDRLNSVSQAIKRIQDPRFVDDYLHFIGDGKIVYESCYMVELLGNLRVKEAIPRLIELLDWVQPITDDYYGTTLEDCKYHISQYAIKALSKFKDPQLIKYIEKFLEPEKLSWIEFTEGKEKKLNYRSTCTQYRKIAECAIKKLANI